MTMSNHPINRLVGYARVNEMEFPDQLVEEDISELRLSADRL